MKNIYQRPYTRQQGRSKFYGKFIAYDCGGGLYEVWHDTWVGQKVLVDIFRGPRGETRAKALVSRAYTNPDRYIPDEILNPK